MTGNRSGAAHRSAGGASERRTRRVPGARCLGFAPAAAALLAGLLLGLAVLPAQAARVTAVSPQGEVPVVRQISLRFDADVVPQGDPRQPAPAQLRCAGQPVAGNARWATARQWLLDLPQPLPAGQRCTVSLLPSWRPSGGAALDGATEFPFSTSGPAVARVWPYNGATIDEDQHLLLQLTGPAQAESVAAHAWCEVAGLGERLPVHAVGGAPRDALIQRHQLQAQADRVLLLACQRPLAPEAKLRLVWGEGIVGGAGGVPTRQPQSFEWVVRERFQAEFSCERERAQAPCMPLRPLVLRFNADVPRAQAAAARLTPDGGGPALAPVLDPDGDTATVRELRFAAPLAATTAYTLSLPAALRDASGRALANAGSFPLRTATGAMPPLAKFASAPFGIVEAGPDAMLPITVRQVQADLAGLAGSGQVRIKRLDASTSDAELLRWLAKVDRYHERSLSAQEAGLPQAQWTVSETETDAQGRRRTVQRERRVGTRELSLLSHESDATVAALPMLAPAPTAGASAATSGAQARPFEVLGIPLPQPGYHVVEVESRLLGRALLGKPAPMYVRTGALVTQLGVHFKRGRSSSLVWVTQLDSAKPVANARVAVNDCSGKPVWSGSTNAQGLALIDRGFGDDHRDCVMGAAWFVTARATDAQGRSDLALVFSDWAQGIEPWRFNQPLASGTRPDWRAHTVFDRTLLRAGETVSMKHFVRTETQHGLALPPAAELPTELRLTHVGSGEQTELPLAWRAGAGSAASQWTIPKTARLGRYDVALLRDGQELPAGDFRVEAFRLPLVDARLSGPKAPAVAPTELPLDLQLRYLNGGGVAGARASLSAMLRERSPQFRGYEAFNFNPPEARHGSTAADDEDDASADDTPAGHERIVVDRQALSTDAQGAARVLVKPLPALQRPSELVAEVSFTDPNGEVQTVGQTLPLWPSAVVVGLQSRSWMARAGRAALQAVVLDTAGKPLADQAVQVRARQIKLLSTRKRMVGGFYAYEHHEQVSDLGVVCEGRSDARGLLDCEATLSAAAGEIELVAEAKDSAGRLARAGASVWSAGAGESWFAQDNDDRIDVLPEQAELQPGQTARLQVRMPFREATALISVEREGLIESRVMTLRGSNPVVELPIPGGAAAASWAPNVYVSVLVLRGRVHAVPWYSFFDWGWRTPREWWAAWRGQTPEQQPPTAMVDLAKPAFKLGVTQLHIGLAAHRLEVAVVPDKAQYGVRQTANVTVTVTRDGQPAAGAQVAFAAVDEALLALRDNRSWDLLGAMFQPRGWGVETATAQGEIIGRRHYGRKAIPAGGGGGRNPTRDLFDTLLLWRPDVTLDAKGQATLKVPLNDSLTRFRLVAVADAAAPRNGQTVADRFGSGSASISVSQDLQLLPGLPPTVREGDQFSAGFTLRNTTGRAMTVEATLQGRPDAGPPLTLPAQRVSVPAGGAAELAWPVTVPGGVSRIAWTGSAQESGGPAGAAAAADRVALTQAVTPAVPLRIWSASLQAVDGAVSVAVAPPADALPATPGVAKQGGVLAGLQPTLAGALPGVRRFFEQYPYTCLEQRASRAVGLQDAAAWTALVADLPGYLDSDGLASYYPPRADDPAQGSDRLTAYLLALSHEAGLPLPPALQGRMLAGLAAFVDGRLQRRFNAPRADGDVRRLAALEALSRHGSARAGQLATVQITPGSWPTAALIDWWLILRRVEGIPDRAQRLQEASRLLRSRIDVSGTQLRFVDEAGDFWWWLMDSPDSNAVRLVLAAADQAEWRDDLPRLALGALSRQQRGAWLTTTANAWGTLAMRRFSARFEATPVAGSAALSLGDAQRRLDWRAQPGGDTLLLPWPPAGAGTLQASHTGAGKPWLTVQTLAAVPLTAPLEAGYVVQRELTPVTQQVPGRWSRGDVMRVRLTVEARADMAWVVLSDPLPTGAAVLGSGLGRDSQIATRGEGAAGGTMTPSFIERGADSWRGVFDWLPRGRHVVEYTLRLSSPGRFVMPPTRVEAMYAPASFAERPNAAVEVSP